MSVKVIDVAKWNPIDDYDALHKDGIEYAIQKAINSTLNKDSLFETHMKGFERSGINVLATYHYVYGSMNFKLAAQRWLDSVNGRCNKFYLDWEDASLPKGVRAVDVILTYADIIKSNGGDFGVYCGYSWFNTYLKKYADKLPYDFWIARYPSNAIMEDEQDPKDKYKPSITRPMDGWQYTSKGKIDGIKGNVDISLWYEDLTESAKVTETVPLDFNPYTIPLFTLRRGALGDDVRWMQWYLYRFGLLLGADGMPDANMIDGMFGPVTESALKIAQKRLGLDDDGVCGKITRSTFKKIC